MKIRASSPAQPLPEALAQTLAQLRARRDFDADTWLTLKRAALTDYFQRHGLRGAVVGVSGGVDSAVVALLLAPLLQAGTLAELVLLALPALQEAGVTGQAAARDRAQAVADAAGVALTVVDIAPVGRTLRAGLEPALATVADPWAAGQGVAILRASALYQSTALLTQRGVPTVVVGTTNRDEGAYLGYVGKASDGLVDLQPIADLHKHEVMAVARMLGVPDVVLEATPTGDMFDACADVDVFGAPYDAVELLILGRTLCAPEQWEALRASWPAADQATWAQMEANLERLHAVNAHKYRVGSPAVHLDVIDSAMPGGWAPARPQAWQRPSTLATHRAAPVALPGGDRRAWTGSQRPGRAVDQDGLRVALPGLLTPVGVQALLAALVPGPWQAASATGNWRAGQRVLGLPPESAGGSWRATFEDPALATALWEQVAGKLPMARLTRPLSRFSGEGHAVWRPCGINPVFRAIAYGVGGLLVPHYDAPFVFADGRRTGMSLTLYLETQPEHGGALRFLHDPLAAAPVDPARFLDWDRLAREDEVAQVCTTEPGDAWAFDHWQLHDSSPLTTGRKVLLRTDVIFEPVGGA